MKEEVGYQTIINFWFTEISPQQWWVKDEAFDQLLLDRFSEAHRQASQCELFTWRECALGRLAEVIVLDQFSRNMFRGSGQAFANDSLSLALAQAAIAAGADQQLTAEQRSFLYMPFMHSESLLIHEQAVALYKENGIEANVEFELKHRAVIERFGRYPHRNKALGRASTAEEVQFINEPGTGF